MARDIKAYGEALRTFDTFAHQRVNANDGSAVYAVFDKLESLAGSVHPEQQTELTSIINTLATWKGIADAAQDADGNTEPESESQSVDLRVGDFMQV